METQQDQSADQTRPETKRVPLRQALTLINLRGPIAMLKIMAAGLPLSKPPSLPSKNFLPSEEIQHETADVETSKQRVNENTWHK